MQNSTVSDSGSAASVEVAEATDAFHLFPQLPPELQLMIWERYGGRILPILPGPAHDDNVYTLPHAPPTLFHVCQDSRKLAKKTHVLIDLAPNGQSPSASTLAAIAKRSIWVDYSKDTLLLIQPGNQDSILATSFVDILHHKIPGLKGTKHMAIAARHFEDTESLYSALPLLQTITIIRNEGLGPVQPVYGGRSARRREDTSSFYFVGRPTYGDLEEGLQELMKYTSWLYLWNKSVLEDFLKVEIRFCDLVQDDNLRHEELEIGEGTKALALVAAEDFVGQALADTERAKQTVEERLASVAL